MAAQAAGQPPAGLPLEGVRVLAQAIVWAGPFGSMILADLGAEVIEIESVQHLSPTRAFYRHISPRQREGTTGAGLVNRDTSEGFWNRYTFFNYAKRAHKSITLDLHSERGHELFLELVRHSDAFVENNAEGVAGHLGIDWPTLSEVNPQLIMIRFPGFGLSGPYRDFKGFGAAMEAIAGHTLIRGYRDSDPSQTPPTYHADPNAGAHMAFALQAALYQRERSGEGRLVEMSQSEVVMHHVSHAWMDHQMNGRLQPHWGNQHPSMAPYGVFPAAEEPGVEHDLPPHVALAVPDDRAWAALCEAMGEPELASDERYADVIARYRNQEELEPRIAAWTRQRTGWELMLLLQAAGVPATMVNRQTLMHGDPHLQARGFFEPIAHPEAGTHLYPGPLARFSEQPLSPVRGPAPTLGQHNHELLCDLIGVSEAEYQRLEADGIIGTVYAEDAT